VLEPRIEGPVGDEPVWYGHCPAGDFHSGKQGTERDARQAVRDHIAARHPDQLTRNTDKRLQDVDRFRWTRRGASRFGPADALAEGYVLVTGRGQASHVSADCPALADGRQKAQGAGHGLADVYAVPDSVACQFVGPCRECADEAALTGDWRPVQPARAVEVFAAGLWRAGWLRGVRRRDDGTWRAYVESPSAPGAETLAWYPDRLVRKSDDPGSTSDG
jgi:hypothetical protein